MKYKLKNKQFEIYKKDIYLLPTIRFYIDNALYIHKNFSISFHWLVFHGRLVFMKEYEF